MNAHTAAPSLRTHRITAVVDHSVKECGTLTYWTCHGGIPLHTVLAALTEAGLPETLHPQPATPRVRLQRACAEAAEALPGTCMVRQNKATGRLTIVREHSLEDGLEYVSLVSADRPSQIFDSSMIFDATKGHALAPGLDEIYNLREDIMDRYMAPEVMTSQDVSSWLVEAIHRFDVLALRSSGGFYFVPHPRVESWKLFASVAAASGCVSISLIDAVANDSSLDAIADALRREVTAALDDLNAEINNRPLGEDGKLAPFRVSTIAKKRAVLHAVRAKLAVYETSLGLFLDEIVERYDATDLALTTAGLLST